MSSYIPHYLLEKITHIKREVQFLFMRSQGPGGQNVNKTNSAVQLRWSIDNSQILNLEEKQILKSKIPHLITNDGELVFKTTESRDQKQNIEIAFEKLSAILEKAFSKNKVRRATKPTRGSKERRIQGKKLQGAKKDSRKKNFE